MQAESKVMDKVRIAVFGISDGIWYALENEIDPRKSEIVLFLDNNPMKQGIRYMDIPIVSPSEGIAARYAVDYILVTALSAYRDIRSELISLGVPPERIQAFIAKDICRYCLGISDNIDMELIEKIYFQPDEIRSIATQYQKLYADYAQLPAYCDEEGAWFHKSRLISHACGGFVNGKRVAYSNSKEAFREAMDKKFGLFECDIFKTDDNELVLGHDYRCFYESEREQYSIMTASELLHSLKAYRETYCIIDVKWQDYNEFVFIVDEIDRIIDRITGHEWEKTNLKNRIVMEVYDEETIRYAWKKNFNMIFTQYRNPDWECFMKTVCLCCKYGIRAIALHVSSCFQSEKFLKIVTDKNINIFAFSTDSIEEYAALRKIGVTGAFTNFLSE